MHELFLTASVKDGDFQMASAILQGLTWMTARKTVHRVLFFAGQPQPRGLPNLRYYQNPQGVRSMPAWNELNKQLTRSSYVLQVAYEVSPDTDFGKGNAADFNNTLGTLRWTDLPDPLRDTPVTQRKKIEIPDQKQLIATLGENNYS
jgi:mediator of RNA polymerase II transcription subunit 18, fungi type